MSMEVHLNESMASWLGPLLAVAGTLLGVVLGAGMACLGYRSLLHGWRMAEMDRLIAESKRDIEALDAALNDHLALHADRGDYRQEKEGQT